eukprot:gb/GEZN01009584.1/.p1 GENE.gb/GEZN01009584.1/~~gb/GEZN01009584.1/.p1  ORF type:complete len:316 (+),score=53.67 gb/GEZN01009584.1/:1-948(+)
MITRLQALWRQNIAAKAHKREVASQYVQRYFRFHLKFRWLHRLQAAVNGKMNDAKSNFGKAIVLPDAGIVKDYFAPSQQLAERLKYRWWANKLAVSINEGDRELMRQKVLCLDLFRGKKKWSSQRDFKGNYLETAENKTAEKFKQVIQTIFQTNGDTHIAFSESVNKVNRKGANQIQSIVVTDKNIYKYWPDKWTVIKQPTPIKMVSSISLSPGKDTFIFIHCTAPHRDFALDMGLHDEERFSELTSLLYEARLKQGTVLPVKIANSFTFNNSRGPKDTNLGKDLTVTFADNPKPDPNCKMTISGTAAVVLTPTK